MVWEHIAEATFFLALAMIATVITIFVFSSSLLGRAVESAEKEQRKRTFEQEVRRKEQIKQTRKELNGLEKKHGTKQIKINDIRKSLEELERQESDFEREVKNIRKGYSVFTVKGGVACPTLYFLSSILLSGAAWGLALGTIGFRVGHLWVPITILLWILSLVPISLGIRRLYYSLKRIQEIAMTSEEAAIFRTVEAFKVAQREIAAEEKPELTLTFTEQEPPFSIAQGGELIIKYYTFLLHGNLASDVQVTFVAPEGFEFVSEGEKGRQTATTNIYPNCPRFRKYKEKVMPFMLYHDSLTIKAPSQPGNFTLAYLLQCDNFTGSLQKFEVQVVS